MILEIDPASPAWVHAVANTVLYLHIGGGSVGLASGAMALISRKGERLHRAAGNIFFISMLIMSAIGAGVAPLLPDRISSVAGIVTFYLVATSWMTVRRKENSTGLFEIVAMIVALGAGATGLTLALMAANSPTGLLDGLPPFPGYLMASLAGLGAATDFKVILRGGISGAPRIARHLWRMCAALAIAAASLFLGQPQVFPKAVQGSLLLAAPVLATLALMIFWLAAVYLTKRFKSATAAA